MSTIRIYSRELKTKDGRIFCKFFAQKKNKGSYEVRFKKEVSNKPTTAGYYLVDFNKASLANETWTNSEGVKIDKPVLWVSEVISISRDVEYEKEMAKLREERINELVDFIEKNKA